MNAPRRGGFTLIELLAVIALILILASLLVPLLGRAKDMGYSTRCMNNIKQIGIACFLFGADHDGQLPGGTRANMQGPQPWEKSWMGREVFPDANPVLPDGTRCDPTWPDINDANRGYGTLLPYIGSDPGIARQIYRCPALPTGPKLGEGFGSNGYFDYSILHQFTGTQLSLIPERCDLRYDTSNPATWVTKITPMIVEEEPYWWMNRSPNVEPSHGNQDRIGTWHSGYVGNYLGRDGTAQKCRPAGGEILNPFCNNWWARGPSGNMTCLGQPVANPIYKSWSKR